MMMMMKTTNWCGTRGQRSSQKILSATLSKTSTSWRCLGRAALERWASSRQTAWQGL